MQFPEICEELVSLVEEDQREIRAHSALYKTQPSQELLHKSSVALRKNAVRRSRRVLLIINEIGTPTEEKIGWEGVEAMTVIALHAKHSAMKRILSHLLQAKEGEIDSSLLPALIDRERILDGKKQLFGTQWFMGFQDKPFLYPVEDFKKMNIRRKEYGLKKARRPRDLTFGIPEKKRLPPLAVEDDQYQPSKAEMDSELSNLYG